MAKMNSTSLYVTTNQIILNAVEHNLNSWQDLYRLLPYLRNSLCCVVCGNLLVDPLTPIGKCNHHLCRKCKGGRKKIKPTCILCRDTTEYTDNKSLRILLQCYSKMCEWLVKSFIFELLQQQARKTSATGVERGAENLISLIKEGAAFYDPYKSSGGLPKSAYSILPCVYTNSATQTLQPSTSIPSAVDQKTPTAIVAPKSKTSLYSVVYPGAGNKITIKRKAKDPLEGIGMQPSNKKDIPEKTIFKKPSAKCSAKPKWGCRCGNATATPGKLTCCGQRCPCYVESKACIGCKCRGCRNPHRPDGNKVRPYIPEIQQQQQQQLNYLPTLQQHKTAPTKANVQHPNVKIEDIDVERCSGLDQLGSNIVKIENIDVEQHYTLEQLSSKYKAYKVVSGDFNGLSIATNLLLNGSILAEDEDDPEITVV